MPARTTRAWTLANAPVDVIPPDAFALVAALTLPELNAGDLLLQTVYLSNDPAQRASMQKGLDAARAYATPIRPGEVVRAFGIARVLESRSAKYQRGQLVRGGMGWQELIVLNEDAVAAIPELHGYSPTLTLGYLGGTALTAWFALHEVCKVKPEHVVLISGAAGATGSAAVQIAKKIIGAKRVIGIAGGPDKCAFAKRLGADECVDYKSPNFEEELIRATEGFVDIYLDQVGGEVLNSVLSRIRRFGHIAACGSISTYNDPKRATLTNWFEVISNRITIHGFIVTDFAAKFPTALAHLTEAVLDGTIEVQGGETVVEASFEDIPAVWRRLFEGRNQGKLVTKLV